MIVQIINERNGLIINLPREKALLYIDQRWPSVNQILLEQVNDWLERNRHTKYAARHFPGMFYLTIIELEKKSW